MVKLTVNGKELEADVEEEMPLLWVLRDVFHLTGTKFGCGIGACGACTVLIGGRAVRSCTLAASAVEGPVTTIEGLAEGETLNRVQQAWLDEQVVQCGYCQSGQILAAVALLAETPQPSEAEIAAAMDNLCRCGTYPRIRRAILRAAATPPV